MSVEVPGHPVPSFTAVPQPIPLRVGDLQALIQGKAGRVAASTVIFAALSAQMLPLGPWPTMTPETPVSTPDGAVPVGKISPGTLVHTPDGPQPVLHVIRATLPARGSFAPVQMFAPFLGLQRDVVVGPDQRLVIEGSDVEYMFGQEAVMVPARHLAGGTKGRSYPCGPVVDYVQLMLQQHAALHVAGVWTESLYLGRLRRSGAAVDETCLRGVERALVPEHALPRYPVLRRFDAVMLADTRAA